MKNIKIKQTLNHGLRGFIFICAIATITLAGCGDGGGGGPNGPDGPGDGNVTVSFNLGGAPGTPPPSIKIQNGTSMGSKCPKDPTRTGYVFEGWFNGTKKYTSTTIINATGEAFTLTAAWHDDSDDSLEYAQVPPIHPGNHFNETGGRTRNVKVNVEFSVNGLSSNVEKDKGNLLTAKWYRVTTSQADADAATANNPKGEEIPSLAQTAPPPGNELSIKFNWKEPAAGTYWYYVIVTNTNENATVSKVSKTITMDRLMVTVTE